MKKIFIVDTNVLLYDKLSIHSFKKNHVVIPISVLDELDRFKDKQGVLGESARYVNRFLDDLRSTGSLHDGVQIESGQNIRVSLEQSKSFKNNSSLDLNFVDNQIISCALAVIENNPDCDVTIVTKDINFRVKCDALNIKAEDYYKDYVEVDFDYSSDQKIKEIEYLDDEIEELYDTGSIHVKDDNLNSNEYVIGKSVNNKSFLGIHRDNRIWKLNLNFTSLVNNIKGKCKEQNFAIDSLLREDIKLVSLTGRAGSGKTFLTLAAGVSGLYEKRYDRIIITRSIQPVGRDLGFLPGTMDEKMAPWLGPINDNLRQAFGDSSYFKMMIQKGTIEIVPLSFIRGRTFANAFLIVDEAQNTTIHELKTIITRVGEGSKIVLLGDTDQIDTPYIDKRSNGLSIAIDRFTGHDIHSHVHLNKGQRSELATLASEIL